MLARTSAALHLLYSRRSRGEVLWAAMNGMASCTWRDHAQPHACGAARRRQPTRSAAAHEIVAEL